VNTEAIKALISGDRVQVDLKGKPAISYTPTCKFIALTNNLPLTNDRTFGFYRKIDIIPFNLTVPESKVDIYLCEKLLSESSGILNLALRGLSDLIENKYKFPKVTAIEEMMKKYKKTGNSVLLFVEDCIIFDDDYLEPLMTADNVSGALVPDDRLDIAELLNGAAQLLIFGVAGFEVASRIVCRRLQLGSGDGLYIHFVYHDPASSLTAFSPVKSSQRLTAKSQ
jgi:hypothetical protein